jgi:hypothetical protein
MKYRIIEDNGTLNNRSSSFTYKKEYCSEKAAKKYLAKLGYIEDSGEIRVIYWGRCFITFRITNEICNR